MRKLLLAILTGIIAFGLIIADAEAKRFGGGRSFGMQRSTNSHSGFNSNNASRMQPAPATAKPAPAGASRWLGPLAGLAIGGLLGSLFMSNGIGTGILSWLLIGGVIFLIWGFIRNRMQPATQPMQNMAYQTSTLQSFTPNKPSYEAIQGFDEAAFLRQAKTLFVRLQTAYDNKNLPDIREFTTPEVFAEIQLQIQERGNENNVTEVISINTQLLDASAEHRAFNASVLFTGFIREEADAGPVAIKEVWHFRKDDFKPNWAVAGIQQQAD